MIGQVGRELGFAAIHDTPIPYLQRIRTYYEALGYGAPYEWAHYAEVPFHPLPGAPYNAAAKFYTVYSGDAAKDHDLRISHVAIDREHTTAEDPATYFPLTALRQSAACGRIGSVAPRFHGLPTNRSHRVTLEVDCPEIVARCKTDGVDIAILVPNHPLSPECQLGGAHAGGERNHHDRRGLRQGHHRACRRAALSVF
jgi:D-proline reductase (dithiol) PrdB